MVGRVTQTVALTLPELVVPAVVPASLLALAGLLRDDSDEIRGRVAAVAGAGDIAWRGAAADLYRDRIAERALAVRAAADVLDDLAAAVGRLAMGAG